MVLKKMEVENFRLLKNFELNLKDELSLIVGKNNCGKTSALIILDKMLNSLKIMWEDINLERQIELYEKICNFNNKKNENCNFLEAIKLRLYIEYNDNDMYTNIQRFMMDLNPENNIIVLEFISLISEKRIIELKEIITEKQINNITLFSKFISKNYSNFFEIKKYSRGFDVNLKQITKDKSEELDNKDIQKVIRISGIRADRAVSNDDRNHVLSNLTGKYFDSYKTSKNESESIFKNLEEELENADNALYKIYNGGKNQKGINVKGVFSDVINVIKDYGGTENGIEISIESSISEKNLLSNNTSLCYMQGNNSLLPETYNGLGYLNLIGILFEIETKIQELYENPADINILYIEEPEAHTHPQLQYIFIRNIRNHIKTHQNQLSKTKNKYLQVLITSHSSHIVSECNFDDIIYFKKIENCVSAKSFNSLEKEYEGNIKKGFKFVRQYLTLNRSELFFADKVICIEGDTERMLIPMMMQKTDKKNEIPEGGIPLLSQNISIIEVGAHSHVFMPLFKFLGLKVLIITDIDAAKKNENGQYVKSNPQISDYTSNASIRNFFEKEDINSADNQFKNLLEKTEEEKIKNNIRIAYQIPKEKGRYQASSFEDEFISCNKEFIIKNKEGFIEYGALKNFNENDLQGDIYTFAQNKVAKKSAFASSILFFDGENKQSWEVPHYIEEGLLWIR